MAVTIDSVFIEEFTNNLISLSQQRPSRFRSYVNEVAATGEGYNWDRIGSVEVSQKTTRTTATPVVDTPFSRRKSIPKTFAVGDVVENSEIVQMLPDPKSAIAMELAYAHNRGYDDEIIAAAVGDSRDGDGGVVAYNAAQSVGAGTTNITIDLITEVAEKFMDNDIDPGVQKIWAVSPAQVRQMLQLTEINSFDYNTVKPLVSGQVVDFMGFSFIPSTRLLDGSLGAGTSYNFAMTADALGLQVNQSMLAKVSEDPSISYAWRVYCEATYGAIRVEDEKVVRIDVTDTVTPA
jgi:hypothetical protein